MEWDRTLVLVLTVCAVMVFGGYLLKAQCMAGWDGREYSRLCYSDIQALYGARGLDQHTFPYIHGDLVDGGVVGGAIEYPVGTGVFIWFTNIFSDDYNAFLRVSALFLAPLVLLGAYWLVRMTGWRALLWAGAPALVFYSFHNWDVLAAAATILGFYLWWRGHPLWAAVAFAIGGAFKIYPLMFVAPLALERWRSSSVSDAVKAAAAGAGTFAALNLPFAIINFDGWWATYAFHQQRLPNFDSIWYLGFPTWSVPTFNRITFLLTAASLVVILVWGYLRSTRRSTYPFIQVSAAMLAAFMLFNKVHSPQYTLWIVPFFVLLNVRLVWWAAYAVIDGIVYVGIFRYYYESLYLHLDNTLMKKLMIAGVWGRAILCAALIGVFMESRDALGEDAPAESTVSDRGGPGVSEMTAARPEGEPV